MPEKGVNLLIACHHSLSSKWPASYCEDGDEEAHLHEGRVFDDIMGHPGILDGGVIAKEALDVGFQQTGLSTMGRLTAGGGDDPTHGRVT